MEEEEDTNPRSREGRAGEVDVRLFRPSPLRVEVKEGEKRVRTHAGRIAALRTQRTSARV